MNRTALILSASSLVLLSACGGSSGSNTFTQNNGNNNGNSGGTTAVTYTQGTFNASSTYKDFCENPRSGAEFADKAGSAMHEKMWLRSFTNETYLWYDEVPDIDPSTYSVLAYFEELKTPDTTASGKSKDQFHFTRDTAEYEKLSQSGVSLGYGVEWAAISSAPPRNYTVAFTENNSPAATANIPRGAELIEVDGVDFVNGDDVDTINDALFPEEGSGSHDFKFRLLNGEELVVSMTPVEVEAEFVRKAEIVETDTGKVAYMQFNSFQRTAQQPLIDAFNRFKDEEVTDLVLDLRYNGGGLLALAAQLSYMISGDNLSDSWFYRQLQNDKIPAGSPTPYYSVEIDYVEGVLTNNTLPTLDLERVFVLTTDGTCSASEAVMNGLLGSGIEVVQIGGTTCGKPYGFVPEGNCGTTYFTVQFKGVNSQGFGDYADGFSAINTLSPNADTNALVEGCDVADDFTNPLGSPSEAQFAAALDYRTSNSCPTPPAVTAAKPYLAKGAEVKDKRLSSLLKNNLVVK